MRVCVRLFFFIWVTFVWSYMYISIYLFINIHMIWYNNVCVYVFLYMGDICMIIHVYIYIFIYKHTYDIIMCVCACFSLYGWHLYDHIYIYMYIHIYDILYLWWFMIALFIDGICLCSQDPVQNSASFRTWSSSDLHWPMRASIAGAMGVFSVFFNGETIQNREKMGEKNHGFTWCT